MKKPKRSVNKKLVDALITYAGHNYKSIADRIDPPITRPMISYATLGKGCPEYLARQLADLLRPVLNDLISEILHVDRNHFVDHLFPCVDHESVDQEGTEENSSPIPEKKEVVKDETRASAVC